MPSFLALVLLGRRRARPIIRQEIFLAIDNLSSPASSIDQEKIATCDIELLVFAREDTVVVGEVDVWEYYGVSDGFYM
jgi:hypothetical protein